MKRRLIDFLVPILLVAVLFVGCGNSETGGSEETDVTENRKVEEVTEAPTETEPRMIGNRSFEECKNSSGIYIAHEDGSFTSLPGGGFVDFEGGYEYGMFMRNKIVEATPSLSKSDKIVLFCDSDYTLQLLPVNWAVGVVYSKQDDGTVGYTRVIKDQYGVTFYTYYNNNETEREYILFVDDISAEDYPFEVEGGENGKSTGYGFPQNETVKLGVKKGSALVEREGEVSATYFDCRIKRGLSVSEDLHCLYPTPTADGYAVVDVYDGLHKAEIPSGKYVMMLRMGKKYIAYLLDWTNA